MLLIDCTTIPEKKEVNLKGLRILKPITFMKSLNFADKIDHSSSFNCKTILCNFLPKFEPKLQKSTSPYLESLY